MIKLKAKMPKSKYKSTDSWLDAIYRNNKVIIDEKVRSTAGLSKKSVFKRLVKEQMEQGSSATRAVNVIERSTIFTSVKERLQANLYSGLKGDQQAYRDFRELTKEKGKYAKFDPNLLTYDYKDKAYYYGDKVKISFENSPQRIIVSKMM